MGYVRFTVSERDSDSGVEAGLFTRAYAVKALSDIDENARQVLADHLAWFEAHVPTPKRFNRSRSKGFYRRRTRGIAWFRDSAAECIARMHDMKRVLEQLGHPVTVVQESRIGYVVYEDEFQVVAEPFSETKTRGR